MKAIAGTLTSLVLALSMALLSTPVAAQDYRVVSSLVASDAGTTQALEVDAAGRRLYAGRLGGIDVYDIDSGSRTGSITVNGAVGGLALAPERGRGYASSIDDGSVLVFDLSTLAVLHNVRSGGSEPRELEYDPERGVVYVSNSGDGRLAVIDAASGAVKGTLALGGRPRQAVTDGRGKLFVTDEARDVLHVVDTASLASLGSIPVWPGKAPVALVNDVKERRLYVTSGNSRMVIIDPDQGQLLASVTTKGTGAAGIAVQYAPARLVRLYMPNADGTLDVARNDKLTPSLEASVDGIAVGTAAAFDSKTGQVFIVGPNGVQAIGK